MVRVIISLAFCCYSIVVSAQHSQPLSSPAPAWVMMIDNPTTNYYTAEKAYSDYWKTHTKPAQEDDEIGEPANRRERRERERVEKRMAKMTTAQRQEFDYIKYQSKRFENWMHEVKPWVQEDGRVLSHAEQVMIWQQQQEEIKKANK